MVLGRVYFRNGSVTEALAGTSAAPAAAGSAADAARASRSASLVRIRAQTNPRAFPCDQSRRQTGASRVVVGPSTAVTLQPRRVSDARRPVSESTVAVKRST